MIAIAMPLRSTGMRRRQQSISQSRLRYHTFKEPDGRSANRISMLRVGYPATLPAELLPRFSRGDRADPRVGQDGPRRRHRCLDSRPLFDQAMRAWPRLRGVKLVLAMMAGTEWIPETVGPHVTICNAHGAHNISTAEWTLAAILAMLKYFPLYLDIQRSGIWKRRFEASAHYAQITGDTRTTLSACAAGRADRQDGAAGRLRRHRQRDRAHAGAV